MQMFCLWIDLGTLWGHLGVNLEKLVWNLNAYRYLYSHAHVDFKFVHKCKVVLVWSLT